MNNTTQPDIFLVDDQQITNFINRKLLMVAGVGRNIYDFKNPYEALESLEKYKPQLILLDLNMPGLNGWEFIEKMEASYSTDARIAIVTSSTSQYDYEKSREYKSILDYLVKPIKDHSLKKLMEKFEQYSKEAAFNH